MSGVEITDNTAEVLRLLKSASAQALEVVGGSVETWAKGLVSGPKSLAPEIRNSLAHLVEDGTLQVGSSLQVTPYIELGTGPNYEPPPEWMGNTAEGGKGRAGIEHWIYFDPLEEEFRIGTPQPARPFLRPAFMEHVEDIRKILEGELREAGE